MAGRLFPNVVITKLKINPAKILELKDGTVWPKSNIKLTINPIVEMVKLVTKRVISVTVFTIF